MSAYRLFWSANQPGADVWGGRRSAPMPPRSVADRRRPRRILRVIRHPRLVAPYRTPSKQRRRRAAPARGWGHLRSCAQFEPASHRGTRHWSPSTRGAPTGSEPILPQFPTVGLTQTPESLTGSPTGAPGRFAANAPTRECNRRNCSRSYGFAVPPPACSCSLPGGGGTKLIPLRAASRLISFSASMVCGSGTGRGCFI